MGRVGMTEISVAQRPDARDLVCSFVIDRVYPAESALIAGGPAAAECMAGLQETARANGLWALPLPVKLGGGGLDPARVVRQQSGRGRSDREATEEPQRDQRRGVSGGTSSRRRWSSPPPVADSTIDPGADDLPGLRPTAQHRGTTVAIQPDSTAGSQRRTA